MFKNLVCGVGSFQHEEDDPMSPPTPTRSSLRSICRMRSYYKKTKNSYTNRRVDRFSNVCEHEEDDPMSPSPTPRRSSLRSGCRMKGNTKKTKNPYSKRGLEKLSNVAADLGERRQKNYDHLGSQDISKVRFEHSHSKDWTPIIVMSKYQAQDEPHDDDHLGVESKDKPTTPQVSSVIKHHQKVEEGQGRSDFDGKTKEKKELKGLSEWKDPCYNLTLLVVLILLCLEMYGRSFAILCVCIWWYLGRNMNCEEKNLRGWMIQKGNVRRFMSEKTLESDIMELPEQESEMNSQ